MPPKKKKRLQLVEEGLEAEDDDHNQGYFLEDQEPNDDIGKGYENTGQSTIDVSVMLERVRLREGEGLSCGVCEYVATEREELRWHVDDVHIKPNMTKIFLCQRCNFESEDQSSVHDHVSSAHPEDLQCSICERVFASPYLVSKHANLSHGGDGRTCRICGRTMSNRKQLSNHMVYAHPSYKLFCLLCRQSLCDSSEMTVYQTQGSFSEHFKVAHLDGMAEFACFLCEYQSSRINNFHKHLQSHNIKITWREVENLRYAHCKVSLNDEDKMLNFLEDTSPEIPRKYYLERRKPVPSVTSPHGSSDGSTSQINPRGCAHCSDPPMGKGQMSRHIVEAHATCRLCIPSRKVTKFKTPAQLEAHSLEFHPDITNLCPLCGVRVAAAAELAAHVAMHYDCENGSEQPQPFVCDACDFESADVDELNTHILKVHLLGEIKQVQVEGAPVSSKNLHDIEQQQASERKLLSCPKCDHFSSNDISVIVEHLKGPEHRVETDPQLQCPHCTYVAPNEERLILHQQRRHQEHSEDASPEGAKATKGPGRKNAPASFYSSWPNKLITCILCGFMVKGKSNMDAHNLDAHSSDGSSWQCDLCDHVSSRKSNLATHMKTHQRPREYICPICPDNHRESLLSVFVEHIRRHADEVKEEKQDDDEPRMDQFSCHVCDEGTFKSAIDFAKHYFQDHIVEGQEGIALRCPLCCCYDAPTLSSFEAHVEEIHKGFKCLECGEVVTALVKFANHLKAHLEKMRTVRGVRMAAVLGPGGISIDKKRCILCGELVAGRSEMAEHNEKVHGFNGMFACPMCPHATSRKSNLLNHQRRNHPEYFQQDEETEQKFKTISDDQAEIKKNCSKTIVADLIECPECSESVYRSGLAAHVRLHLVNEFRDSSGEFSITFACPECEENQFAGLRGLSDHLEEHERQRQERLKPSKVRVYNCQLCEFTTYRRAEQLRHSAQVHGSARDFCQTCPECGYQSRQKFNFRMHMQTHHGILLNGIPIVPHHIRMRQKKRTQEKTSDDDDSVSEQSPVKQGGSNNKKKRVAVKDDDRRAYNCPLCCYISKNPKTQTAHLKEVHGCATGTLHRCKRCSYTSNRRGNFQVHVLNQHGIDLRLRTPEEAMKEDLEDNETREEEEEIAVNPDLPKSVRGRRRKGERFKCLQCKFSASVKSVLDDHVVWKHSQNVLEEDTDHEEKNADLNQQALYLEDFNEVATGHEDYSMQQLTDKEISLELVKCEQVSDFEEGDMMGSSADGSAPGW